MGLLPMLGFALLGGLILNLMPCVLPVLGLKLHSVLNAGTENRRMIRGQFLASAAGILFSFWLLAGFLWILKITGQRSEEHTSELQSRGHLVCRLLLEKKN